MAATLEARAIITAEDKTGPAFESVKAKIASISKVAEVMNRAMGSVGPIAKQVGAVSEQVDRTSAAMRHLGEAGKAVSSVAGSIASVERASAGMSTSISRSSAAVQKLSGELSAANAKLTAIANFKGANKALDETSLAFRRGQRRCGACRPRSLRPALLRSPCTAPW